MANRFLDGSFEYLQNNSAALYEQRGTGVLLALAYTLLSSATILLATLASSRSVSFYLAMALIVLDALLGIMGGARVALIGPIVVLIFRHFENWRVSPRDLAFAAAMGGLVFFIVLPASSVIADMRQEGAVSLSGLYQQQSEATTSTQAVGSTLFEKFDSFSTGAILVERGGMGAAGLMPYYGSAFVFIPSAIYPWRPVAGSADGTVYGHPTRLVPALLGIVSDAYNVGVSPLHVALWQLGIWGFPVFVMAGTCYLLFLNHLLGSPYVWSRVVGISLLNIPAFSQVFPSPDVILKQCIMATLLVGGGAIVQRLVRRWSAD